MPLQDLTPQLRTRLSRVERVVGWFVLVASLLLAAGFAYYFYVTAERKGWFITKVPYYTYLKDATGLRIGDPVRLMGFDVGQVVEIEPTEAGNYWYNENQFNVYVKFLIRQPYYGYIWSDSKTKVSTGDFLGKRVVEVTKGSNGVVTVIEKQKAKSRWLKIGGGPVPVSMLQEMYGVNTNADYVPITSQPRGFWLHAMESPALTERFDRIADRIEGALPGFFTLTNRIAEMLTNGNRITTNLNTVIVRLEPVMSNIERITAILTNSDGSVGKWVLGTNLQGRIGSTLDAAHSTLQTADTNLTVVSSNLNLSLIHLANITSNLNSQVQTNEAIVKVVSDAIRHADEFVQGLKRHWLLRSAFKGEEKKKEKAAKEAEKPPPQPGIRRGKNWEK